MGECEQNLYTEVVQISELLDQNQGRAAALQLQRSGFQPDYNGTLGSAEDSQDERLTLTVLLPAYETQRQTGMQPTHYVGEEIGTFDAYGFI